MTFREKSAAITLAGLVLTYGVYGWRALSAPMSTGEAMALLTGLIVLQVVIVTIAHIAVAAMRRPERIDERDRMVELRGPRNAYFVLVAGVVGVMALALLGVAGLAVANALLAVLVVAEAVRFGSQLIYYRIGV